MANQVYDPETEGEQPTYRSPPDLGRGHNQPDGNPTNPAGHDTASGDTSDPRGEGPDSLGQSQLRDAENGSGSFFNANGEGTSPANGLLAAEAGASAGHRFNPNDDNSSTFQKLKAAAKAHRKGVAIGAGAGGGIIALLMAVFFFIVPLKIEHIVTNLENRFYSSSNDAVGTETESLLDRYIATRVLPAYQSCGSTVSKNCSARKYGDGPVANLYQTWANDRLENKLADNYGIEFKYDSSGKTWYLKAPGTTGQGDDIGSSGDGLNNEFQRADRATMRSAVADAMESETGWKKVMVRYQVGRLLDEKYGIKRCIMVCGTRDQLADAKDKKKLAAQLYITQRVITPRTQTLGIVMECMFTPSCNPEQTEPTQIQDGVSDAPSVAENSDTDTKARQAAQTLAAKFAGDSADDLVAEYTAASEKGFQKYLLEKVLDSVGLDAVSSQASDAVPIIGAVNQAASVISFVDKAGPAVQKLGYITNAQADASIFMMYRTYADEIHTGHVDPAELGSMTSSLAGGDSGATTDPEKGGTASAEQTPLYQTIMNDGSSSGSNVTYNSGVLGKASADSSGAAKNTDSYKCDDGKPVPSGKLVCNEEVLGQSNGTLDSAHQFLHSAPIAPITGVAHAISGVTGAISNFFGNIITSIPGVSNVTDFVGSILQPFFQDVINTLIPNPFSSNMSGGRKFDLMAGGADVAGNDYAQTGLGGKKLDNQQLADIVNKQQREEQLSFSHQSLFARMFNTDSQDSLISKVAMSMPLGAQASAQSGMADLMNPFSALSHNFSSILSGKVSAAAATAQPDPFNVTQYGYPPGTVPNDPETYWAQHCSDNAAQAYQNDTDYQSSGGGKGWVGEAAAGTPDPSTGMPVNTTTNPCLLIKATVGAAGGKLDTSNLTQFDLAETQDTATSTPSSPVSVAGLTNPFPGGWIPNRLDMGYDGTFKGKIVAPFSGTITYASDSFSNWGGWLEIKADKDFGQPSSTLYFAEGVHPTVQSGQHVSAGDPIASPAPSPYGNAYGTNSSGSGEIEWGLAQEGSVGSPTNTYVYGQCGSSSAKSTVLNFSQWAQKQLGLQPPSETSNAGCP